LAATVESRTRSAIKASLRKPLRPGQSAFDRWNDETPAVIGLVEQYTHRLALEELVHAASRHPDHAELLTQLCRVVGLQWIIRHADTYLAHDALAPKHVGELEERLNSAVAQLYPYTNQLVDGLGVRADILAAPVAAKDYISSWAI